MTSKRCPRCKEEKLSSSFFKRSKKSNKLSSWCKKCLRDMRTQPNYRKQDVIRSQEWQIKNKESCKRAYRGRLLRRYWPGSTSEEALQNYENLLSKQNYSCAICKKHQSNFKKSLAVDHNHKFGHVRGALCYRCNRLYVSIHTTATAKSVYEYLLERDGE